MNINLSDKIMYEAMCKPQSAENIYSTHDQNYYVNDVRELLLDDATELLNEIEELFKSRFE